MINLVLSSHRIDTAQICPRLFNYIFEVQKGPITDDPDYFQEGTLMHWILAEYYRAKMDGKNPDYELIFELARNYAAENLTLKSELIESTITDAQMYFDFYVSDNWIIEGVEEPFAKELFSNDQFRIVVTGRNDLRIRIGINGPRVIVDHKYEAQFRNKGDRDNQPLTYCWGYNCRNFLFNRIGKQQSYKPDKRLQRPLLSYGEHQIEEWKDSAIYTALEILKFHEANYWPARYSACQIHGKKCTFYDLCNTTPSNREYKLNTFFKDKPPYDEDLMEGKKR